jgi:putative two-component system response regulator
LAVAKSNLADTYTVFTAPSGEKMFFLLEVVMPDIILLDVDMPDMDGYQVIELLKKDEKTVHIPIIFLSSKIDPESEIKGLNLGAVDYITKPFSRELLLKRLELHILLGQQKRKLTQHNLTLVNTVSELQNTILKTVAELVECRDKITGGHIERTQYYLKRLVELLLEHDIYTDEISSWDFEQFILSSQLHDVGKIQIKDDLLGKPGKLTDEEMEEMKKHTLYGVEIIKRIEENTTENSFLHYAGIFACSHHEKWNGEGYPYGLKGEEIPLHGRLMAIVDVYDALTNIRPYKNALSHEEAMEIIKETKGTHFDPLISDVFIMHEAEFNIKVIPKMTPKVSNTPQHKTQPKSAEVIKDESGTYFDPVLVEMLLKLKSKYSDVEDVIRQLSTEK